MKVPIEDGIKDKKQTSSVNDNNPDTQVKGDTSKREKQSNLSDEEEAAMVEAAKRAGVAAAEADFAAEAERVKATNDKLLNQLDEAKEEVDAAKKQAADAADKLVRLQADWENYRRRTAQERLDEKQRAAEGLIVNLLPVLDDMERAFEHAQDATDTADSFGQFIDGMQAVHTKMIDILSKEGVSVIDPLGEPFDPLHHQAVGRVENKDIFDETVAQVYQKGYELGGKTIRTAMVVVSFGGPKRPEPQEDASASFAADGDKQKDKASSEAKSASSQASQNA